MWESETPVCLRSLVSDRCISGGLELKNDLGGQMFSAYLVISVYVF